MKVVCLCTGNKYPAVYVEKLYSGFARNTTVPLDFEVIRETKYPGWWGKIEQFAPKERIILIDIDVVITGNVDFLDEYQGEFCAWADPLTQQIAGGLHSIAPGFGQEMMDRFFSNPSRWMNMYYSDQEFLRDYVKADYWPKGLVQSYKFDSLEDGPKDARIVQFHGDPKPAALPAHHWVWKYWI